MNEITSKLASGLNALMQEYEASSHNIANSGTAGYKRKVTSFSAELQKSIRGDYSPMAGTIKAQESSDFTQGQLVHTGQPLDVGLEGKGFITLDTPSGRLFTRNGALQINILGQLTDLNGHRVAGQNGPITIPGGVNEADISIDQDGVLRAGEAQLGQIRIMEFDKPAEQLTGAGNGCYRGPEDYRPVGPVRTVVRQGYREQSNVKIMEELTGLLSVSRAFEANMSMLKRGRENSSAMIEVAKS
jgi:flagellar basal-body rod protein FlgF